MKKIIIVVILLGVSILYGCRLTSDINSPAPTPAPVITTGTVIEDNSDSNNTPVPPTDSDQAEEAVVKPSNPLDGKIICIDPGHGNPDKATGNEKLAPESDIMQFGGAYGTTGVYTKIPEYKLNMIVSVKLKTALEEEGCNVIMTRLSDDENLSNVDRAVVGNEVNSDLVIRIHADGSNDSDVNGVSVLYPGSKYISDTDLLIKSKKAAQLLHDSIIKITGAKPRGVVERDDLIGFNWTTRPVVLIEMGFMTNPEEDKLLNDPLYQDKTVEGIVEGLRAYFNEDNENKIKAIIDEKASDIVNALKEKDMMRLSGYVYPDSGIRFSPYGYVDIENDIVIKSSDIITLNVNKTVYTWGSYDGTGDPINLTFNEYYQKFIYDVDFASAKEVGYNKTLGQGNSLNNSAEVYKDSIIVEYHFPGFNPEYEGMDWRSLRLVFQRFKDTWYLVGIIHDQWTI